MSRYTSANLERDGLTEGEATYRKLGFVPTEPPVVAKDGSFHVRRRGPLTKQFPRTHGKIII